MKKRFILRKEFFGGILYDNKTKSNILLEENDYKTIENILNNDEKLYQSKSTNLLVEDLINID